MRGGGSTKAHGRTQPTLTIETDPPSAQTQPRRTVCNLQHIVKILLHVGLWQDQNVATSPTVAKPGKGVAVEGQRTADKGTDEGNDGFAEVDGG